MLLRPPHCSLCDNANDDDDDDDDVVEGSERKSNEVNENENSAVNFS
jgi:hypothetical protein